MFVVWEMLSRVVIRESVGFCVVVGVFSGSGSRFERVGRVLFS